MSIERPRMPRYCCPCCHHHCCCAQPFTLLPSSPLWGRARNGWQCRQDTLFCLATINVAHHSPCCRLQCLCTSKQGTADNTKAPSSLPPPPSLSRTIIHSTAMIAIVQEGKEQPLMPPWHCLLLPHCLSALPLSLLLCEQARDGQQWSQGIIFCSATIVIAHHHPRCCH